MKTLLSLLAVFSMFIITSCSDNPAAGPDTGGGLGAGNLGGGGMGGGGNGTGNVSFTMGLATDQQGQYYFEFKPSTGIVVTQIVARCQALNVNETVPVTDGNVYSNAQPLYLGPVQNLQQGQQWQFTVTGKVGSATGQNFTANANLTVQ